MMFFYLYAFVTSLRKLCSTHASANECAKCIQCKNLIRETGDSFGGYGAEILSKLVELLAH